MNYTGLLIGLSAFFCIGLFHPIVIWAEYHFSKRCWWIFLLIGLATAITSLFINNVALSTFFGVFAFSCFWSIIELFQQEKRVKKGWFPANPKRKKMIIS